MTTMNGARALLQTLVDNGVEVCFANPGTSEMHFVAALDDVPQMRAILGLFEGVVTGAADGYARIAGKPAATLLHLGPGLGNGWASLHNARRAFSPVVNIVGDHATYHKKYDAPLESDIEPLADALHGWTHRSTSTADIGADAAAAIAAAVQAPGQVASLILPADISWGVGGKVGGPIPVPDPTPVTPETIAAVAEVLRGDETVLILLGGPACLEAGLRAASSISNATGADVLVETFPARLERGAGLPPIQRLAYRAEAAQEQLKDVRHVVLAGTRAPVTFFAYPGMPSEIIPDGVEVHTLARRDEDVVAALQVLASTVAADVEPTIAELARPDLPTGPLSLENWVQVIGALLPEGAIISDEANTSGLFLPPGTAGSPRHDLLTLTGGAIGQGMPVATGAAVAAPNRPVINLQADGSAMYSIQSLWTQARENLDVTTIILNNSAYAILRLEMQKVGASLSGPAANTLLDLSSPGLNFVHIAEGMGVPATRATTSEELADQLRAALAESGPHLIDAIIPALI